MKIRNILMLGASAILISTSAIAATPAKSVAKTSIENDFAKLEAEFKLLEQKETERFKEEEKIAKSAEQSLATLKTLKTKSSEREKQLVSMEGRSIYSEEVKRILKEYQIFISQVDKQQKIEERKLFEFNQLKSLR